MRFRHLRLPVALGLFMLGGCASGALQGPVQAQSTCHTSNGDFVPSPGCSVNYSINHSTTTVTSTTTTTTTTPSPPATPPPTDEDES